ncbi:GntR family transcriptional regulator [Oscillospiraceae bacterium MB08-C2-2]|nr:GntR family transcriptional regulator [Oscillospiraceae bacterium MB08-C2-2]
MPDQKDGMFPQQEESPQKPAMPRSGSDLKKEGYVSSLKNYVYQQIVEKICAGELVPEVIFTEKQMIETFGVSKAPVREALVQLSHEGVLRCIPRCGYQVIQISAKNIHDLTELRLFLELSSLPNVLANLTEEKIREFKEMNKARLVDIETRDVWTAWNNNITFHLRLNECGGNAQVTAALERDLAACTRAYAQLFREQRQLVVSAREHFHDHIISSLERSELYTAQNCLKQDILLMEQNMLGSPSAQIEIY